MDLFQIVKKFNLPPGKFAIFGSGPMCIRGLKECSHDLDIIVSKDLWDEYAQKSEWNLMDFPQGGEKYLENNHIELWKHWGPGNWDIIELIKDSEIIEGLPFVKLETVLKWKQINGREKDLKDIEIIKSYLNKTK